LIQCPSFFSIFTSNTVKNLRNMQNRRPNNLIKMQANEYEAMSQKGTVGFIEKTVFHSLIDYYCAESRIECALNVIDHAVEQYPYSSSFYCRKGEILVYSELFQEALTSLNIGAMYAPGSVTISILKVKALMGLKNISDAFEIIDTTKSIAFGKDLSQIYCCEAILHESTGKFNQMFDSLSIALTIDPYNEEALESITWAVEMTGNYDESIILYNNLLEKHPYCDRAWFNLGQAYACLEDDEMAAEAYEYAFITNEENEFAYRECMYTYIKLKQYRKALECYQDAADRMRLDGELLVNIGFCHEKLNDLKTAQSYYNRAIRKYPKNDRAYYQLAECFGRNNQWNKALKSYKKAVLLNRRKEEYITGLAEAFYQTGEIEKARSLFQKAADTAPETTFYWLRQAEFLLDIGEAKAAIVVLDEAEIYAEGIELFYCRIACLFYLNKREEALYFFGEALIENYTGHDYIFRLIPALAIDTDILHLIDKYRPF